MNSSVLTFPAVIPYGDLKKCHPEYSLDKIERHNDLYHGGDAFRSRIDRYLLKLQEEMYSRDELRAMYFGSFNPKAESHGNQQEWDNRLQNYSAMEASHGKQWTARKARAWYEPIVAGLLDFMIAAIFQSPPLIIPGNLSSPAADEEPENESQNGMSLIGEVLPAGPLDTPLDYWHRLNLDVDGKGTTIRELLSNALLELLLHKRAYLSISFDGQTPEGALFDAAKNSGGLDARVNLLTAQEVDDWSDDNPRWIRTHHCIYERSQPFKQPDRERNIWTYITDGSLWEYELEFEKGKPPDDSAPVQLKDGAPKTFSMGFPIVEIPCNVWVMDRLAETALGLFNRQASLTWNLDKSAYALLILKTNRALKTVVDSTLGAVRVDPGDDAKFVSPDMAISTALLKDIERFKEELHSAVQAMVLQAAAKDSGDRASGVAKQRDFGALATLLTPFAMALKESLAAILRKIRDVRKDDVSLVIHGLDKYDVQSLEAKLANALTFISIPGAPETGKKVVVADATLAMMPNSPTQLREKVLQEITTAAAAKKEDSPLPPGPGRAGTFARPPAVNSGQKPIDFEAG